MSAGMRRIDARLRGATPPLPPPEWVIELDKTAFLH
jgi:hypothetical protein